MSVPDQHNRYAKMLFNADGTRVYHRPGAKLDMGWSDRAACRGVETEIFYPESDVHEVEALTYCNGDVKTQVPACPVRNECLIFAQLRNDITVDRTNAVLGGMTERQRRRFAKAAARNPIGAVR